MNVSAIILTKNEEKNIADCINSLDWVDQIVVIDDFSNDRTADLAKSLGAQVFQRSLDGDFSGQRNYGLSKTSGDYILFLDADERASEALAFEISNAGFLNLNSYDGFYIKRLDSIWGKILRYGETGNINFIRLAKKESGLWVGKVHEKWKVKGKIGYFKNPIIHFPHQSIADFLKEINFYTSLRAKSLFEDGKGASFLSVVLYPKVKFFQNYFLKKGFLDGIPGLIHALLMSFHSFLVRSKLWQLSDK